MEDGDEWDVWARTSAAGRWWGKKDTAVPIYPDLVLIEERTGLWFWERRKYKAISAAL